MINTLATMGLSTATLGLENPSRRVMEAVAMGAVTIGAVAHLPPR